VDGAERPNDRVAWTCDCAGIRIETTSAVAKLANKAVADARVVLYFGFFEAQVIEQAPERDGKPGQRTAANSTEPAGHKRRVTPGDTVRHEKVDVLLKEDMRQCRSGSA
jgi:hypothetical protein